MMMGYLVAYFAESMGACEGDDIYLADHGDHLDRVHHTGHDHTLPADDVDDATSWFILFFFRCSR